MRGNTNYQVQQLFREVENFGESKHDAKEEAREEIEARGDTATWHEVGKEIGVYSHATADQYRCVWRDILDFAKVNWNIKDAEKIGAEQIAAYMDSKIDAGCKHATIAGYAAAIEKMETALNRYAESHGREARYDFSGALDAARDRAHGECERFSGSRAYEDPRALIAAIDNDSHRLAASIQYEGGCRISEASLIRPGQLQGMARDEITGREVGQIEIKGKGGKINTVQVLPETYDRLADYIAAHGEYRINQGSYRDSLRDAAEATGQEYTGSHGLRWSYATERMDAAQDAGYCWPAALSEVSHDMGHERPDITEHYLG